MQDEDQQVGARHFAFALIQTYAASLLLEQAQWFLQKGQDSIAIATALRFCARDLTQLLDASADHQVQSRRLALN